LGTLGIPIAYPRLVFLEKMLGSNLNPLVALGKAGKAAGFKGFFNKFNQDAELLDDLVCISDVLDVSSLISLPERSLDCRVA
jgi:hypothetical protein